MSELHATPPPLNETSPQSKPVPESGVKTRPYRDTLWAFGLVLLICGSAFTLFQGAPDRGFSLSGHYQLESIEGAHAWVNFDGVTDLEVYRSNMMRPPYRGPANGMVPATLFLDDDPTPEAVFEASRLTNTGAVLLAVLCVFWLGFRIGGFQAGVGAALTVIAVPRIWAAATTPGLTALALCAFTVGAFSIERVRDQLRWLIPGILVLVLAFNTSQLAFLLLIPWVYLTFFGHERSKDRGTLESRPLTWWGLAFLPLVLLVFVKTNPAIAGSVKDGLLEYFSAFLQPDRQPTLYFGEIFAAKRLPWHASLVLTALTMPPTLFFLAVFGVMSSSPLALLLRRFTKAVSPTRDVNANGALRLCWCMLLLTLAVPLLMGTSQSHGVDLLALVIPWCAVFTGVGFARVLRVITVRLKAAFEGRAWARTATIAALSAFGWAIFIFAFMDTADARPHYESYYNWLIDGVDGAAESGLGRNPGGPIPIQFLSGLIAEDASVNMSLLPAQHWHRPVLDRYHVLGLMPAGLLGTSIDRAELIVFAFDETLEGFYSQLPDFYDAATSVDESSVRWLRHEGLPLYGAVRLTP